MGKVKVKSTEKKVVSKFEKKGAGKTTGFKAKSIKEKPTKLIAKAKKVKNVEVVSAAPSINRTYVESGVIAALKAIKLNESKSDLLDSDISIHLQFSLIKIPQCPSRIIQVKLPHTLLTDDSEICFITADLKNEDGKNHDKNIDFYENLFKERGITRKITIIPYHQIRTEYLEFEMQRRLFSLYDYFFVDGRISGFVQTKFFYHYYKSHKSPILIEVDAVNIKDKIETALLKQEFHLHPNGDSLGLRVGHSNMKVNDIVENVLSTHEFIERDIPGGFNNIRNIHLFVNLEKKCVFLPIYMTLKNNKDVPEPVVKSKRPKHFISVTDELSTLEADDTVTVHPDGEIVIHTSENNLDDSEETPQRDVEATAEVNKVISKNKRKIEQVETEQLVEEKKVKKEEPEPEPIVEKLIPLKTQKKVKADKAVKVEIETEPNTVAKKNKKSLKAPKVDQAAKKIISNPLEVIQEVKKTKKKSVEVTASSDIKVEEAESDKVVSKKSLKPPKEAAKKIKKIISNPSEINQEVKKNKKKPVKLIGASIEEAKSNKVDSNKNKKVTKAPEVNLIENETIVASKNKKNLANKENETIKKEAKKDKLIKKNVDTVKVNTKKAKNVNVDDTTSPIKKKKLLQKNKLNGSPTINKLPTGLNKNSKVKVKKVKKN